MKFYPFLLLVFSFTITLNLKAISIDFSSDLQAWARAAEIGQDRGYAYWSVGSGTKYQFAPNGSTLPTDGYEGYFNQAELDIATSSNVNVNLTGIGSSYNGYQSNNLRLYRNTGALGNYWSTNGNWDFLDGGGSSNLLNGSNMVDWNSDFEGNGTLDEYYVYESWMHIVLNETNLDRSQNSLFKMKISGIELKSDYSDVSIVYADQLTNPYAWGTMNGIEYAGYNSALNSLIEIDGNDVIFDFTGIQSADFKILLSPEVSAVPEPSTYALILGVVALGFTIRRRK